MVSEPLPAVCPKCASPRTPGASECPSCGVVYARFRPRQAQAPRAAALAPVPAPAAPRRFWLDGRRLESLLTVVSQGLEAGLPLTSVFGGPVAAGLPADLARALVEDARASLPISTALGRISSLDAGALALILAGERHGRLPEALRQAAARLAERRKDRSRLLLVLAYPAFLFVVGALLLPLPTLIRDGPGAYFARVLPLLLGLGATAFLALFVLPRQPAESSPRRALRALGNALPLVGGGLWAGALATFADVLGTCLSAGLPAAESLRMAARSSGHPRLLAAEPLVLGRIEAGDTLAGAIGVIPEIDPGFAMQIAAGERSGTLDRILPTLSADWRRRARQRALVAVAVAGALALLGVASVLVYEVVSSWTTFFEGQGKGFDAILRE